MSPISRREVLKLSAFGSIGALSGTGCSWVAGAGASPSVPRPGQPLINTRMFWTWDHSTEWSLNLPGAHTIGSCSEYDRTTAAFIQDYTALFSWCRSHNINAVIVWGLLRVTHGGLDSAKQLCDVAAEYGVRLLCGVGLNAYGGVYYEGNSPYNLETHLQANPQLYAVDANGNSINCSTDWDGNRYPLTNTTVPGPRGFYMACPSRVENQEFIADSLVWLFKNLPLGGVQMETGDTGVCQCTLCRNRRQYPVSSFSWEDMALLYPLAAKAIRSVASDAWIVCETYSHPQPYDAGPGLAPDFGYGKPPWADAALAAFPPRVFVQWVGDRYVREDNPALVWTAEGRPPRGDLLHQMRVHFGTDWGWGAFRGEDAVDWIAKLVKMSMAAGIQGITMFGEVSPLLTGAELNYLALTDFGSTSNPTASRQLFEERIAAPLLGGADNAYDFAQFAGLLDRLYPDRLNQIPAALPQMYSRLTTLTPEAARRWCWLASEMASYTPL